MRKLVLLLSVAALVGATVATVDASGASAPRARAVKMRLKQFPSCTRLVKYARHYAPRELRNSGGPVLAPGTPPSFTQTDDSAGGGRGEGAPTAAPTPSDGAGGDSSGTNVQEAGVD